MCKKLINLCGTKNEIICSELTIKNKKWVIFSVYRPALQSNLKEFVTELEKLLNTALSKYDNIVVMGDININLKNNDSYGFNLFNTLCETYHLKNLIKSNTCFKQTSSSSIDVILTSKPKSFQHTATCETGLSDCHHMIKTFFKSHLVRLKPKKIFYRNYKKVDENIFLNDVAASNFSFDNENPDTNYDSLVTTFSAIIDKHAPLKQKVLRGNDAPFMNKELTKAIYHRSKLKNYYNKNRTEESKLNYKKQRNKCVNLHKKLSNIISKKSRTLDL